MDAITLYASAINCVSADHRDVVSEHLKARRTRVLVLDGRSARDKRSLLDAVAAQWLGNRILVNWSQFDDLLRERVLAADGAPEQALVWDASDSMLQGGLGDLIAATDSLLTLARSATRQGKVFRSFLMGQGANYR